MLGECDASCGGGVLLIVVFFLVAALAAGPIVRRWEGHIEGRYCKIDTDAAGNNLNSVLVPVKKINRMIGKTNPQVIWLEYDRLQRLSGIVYADLARTEGVPVAAWDTGKWRDITLLKNGKCKATHWRIVFNADTENEG